MYSSPDRTPWVGIERVTGNERSNTCSAVSAGGVGSAGDASGCAGAASVCLAGAADEAGGAAGAAVGSFSENEGGAETVKVGCVPAASDGAGAAQPVRSSSGTVAAASRLPQRSRKRLVMCRKVSDHSALSMTRAAMPRDDGRRTFHPQPEPGQARPRVREPPCCRWWLPRRRWLHRLWASW
jgi:hypothetical protein